MSEEVKRIKKQIVTEEEVVELKIELSGKFYDGLIEAKAKLAEARGFDITIGEYMEQSLEELVEMVKQMEDHILKSEYDKKLPEVVDKNDGKDLEAAAAEEEVPPELYAHLEENYENDPMIG